LEATYPPQLIPNFVVTDNGSDHQLTRELNVEARLPNIADLTARKARITTLEDADLGFHEQERRLRRSASNEASHYRH